MSNDSSHSNPWHWFEHPVGLFGEVARACVRALLAFLIGLGGTFALILCAGILAEEDLLDDPGLSEAIDNLSRMSAGVMMVLAVVAWGAFAVACLLREVTTSRALVKATERGASRHDVPSPEQVESVTRAPAQQLSYFGWANGVLAGLFGVVALGIGLVDGNSREVSTALPIVGYALVMTLVGFAGRLWLNPAHERRQVRIAAHWTSDDESKAWRPAQRARRDGKGKKTGFFSVSERFIYIAALVAVVGFVALTASLSMRCSATPGGVAQECEETTYSSFIENILAFGFWIFAVLLPLAALLAVIGVLLHWRQRSTERTELRAVLADPYASRPAENLLAYHARRRMHPLALVSAALAGAGLVVSTSAYLVGEGQGLGSEDVFAVYRTESLVGMAVSVGLFAAALIGSGITNVRGRALRNELMRRWPTAPSWSANGEGKVLRAKRGPALRGARYVKVGKNASSDRS